MKISRSLVATVLVGTLFISTPAFANNGKSENAGGNAGGNSQNNTNLQATENAAAKAASDAAQAAAAAKAEREAAQAVVKEISQEVQETKKAAQAAANEAKAAEKAAEGSSSDAAKAEAQAKKTAAAKLEAEAKKIASELKEANRQAAIAKANENAQSKLAKALGKIQSASDPCVEFLAGTKPEAAAECQEATYVVRFQNGVDANAQVAALKKSKFKVSKTLDGVIQGAVASLTANQLKALANSGKVTSIEEDFEIKIESTQTDPTWGLDRIDQTTLPLSGSYTNSNLGLGVDVYVVDTGVLTTHQEFTGRIKPGYSSIADGRGVTDCNGHGTHVAGTAAGSNFGVAKEASIVPVRVLACDGSGTLSGVIAGLDWVGGQLTAGSKAVVNLSLGGGASSTLDQAISSLIARGATVVVAAGNSASDACNFSPARVSEAITVAASASNDSFASFSNFGSCVDLIAPGVGVLSSVSTSDTATASYSGTSMASPHVAGLAASLLTVGYLTPAEVSASLTGSAAQNLVTAAPATTPNLLAQVSVPVGANPGTTPVVATVPIAPELTQVVLNKNAATVSWKISDDGGSPLTGHVVRIWERGQLIKKLDVSATATLAKVSGLKWGVSYTFTVLAKNAIGLSTDSIVSTAITPTRN